MKTDTGFAPISRLDARILILGSMPGQKSLEKHEYYGHPQNSFWKIMGELYDFDFNLTYQERTKELLKNKVALWDVLKSCIRPGSLDSSIETSSMVVNDFEAFLEEYREIKIIAFNGAKAEQVFLKEVKKNLTSKNSCIPLQKLPSTSPANARMTFEQKLKDWSRALRENT